MMMPQWPMVIESYAVLEIQDRILRERLKKNHFKGLMHFLPGQTKYFNTLLPAVRADKGMSAGS